MRCEHHRTSRLSTLDDPCSVCGAVYMCDNHRAACAKCLAPTCVYCLRADQDPQDPRGFVCDPCRSMPRSTAVTTAVERTTTTLAAAPADANAAATTISMPDAPSWELDQDLWNEMAEGEPVSLPNDRCSHCSSSMPMVLLRKEARSKCRACAMTVDRLPSATAACGSATAGGAVVNAPLLANALGVNAPLVANGPLGDDALVANAPLVTAGSEFGRVDSTSRCATATTPSASIACDTNAIRSSTPATPAVPSTRMQADTPVEATTPDVDKEMDAIKVSRAIQVVTRALVRGSTSKRAHAVRMSTRRMPVYSCLRASAAAGLQFEAGQRTAPSFEWTCQEAARKQRRDSIRSNCNVCQRPVCPCTSTLCRAPPRLALDLLGARLDAAAKRISEAGAAAAAASASDITASFVQPLAMPVFCRQPDRATVAAAASPILAVVCSDACHAVLHGSCTVPGCDRALTCRPSTTYATGVRDNPNPIGIGIAGCHGCAAAVCDGCLVTRPVGLASRLCPTCLTADPDVTLCTIPGCGYVPRVPRRSAKTREVLRCDLCQSDHGAAFLVSLWKCDAATCARRTINPVRCAHHRGQYVAAVDAPIKCDACKRTSCFDDAVTCSGCSTRSCGFCLGAQSAAFGHSACSRCMEACAPAIAAAVQHLLFDDVATIVAAYALPMYANTAVVAAPAPVAVPRSRTRGGHDIAAIMSRRFEIQEGRLPH